MNDLADPKSGAARYRHASVAGCMQAHVEQRPDGTTLLCSTEPLGPYAERLTDHLEHWAAVAPDRCFVARRQALPDGSRGEWVRVSYAQMLQRVQAVAQSLLPLNLSPERPIAILSENSIEHLTLALAGYWIGVPHVPVSTAYSLISQDFGKLRHVLAITTPGLVFASGPAYAKAIAACVAPGVEVLASDAALAPLLQATNNATSSAELAAIHGDLERTGGHSIAKFLFTSGSTLAPKGVITTQRMMCANLQMIRQALAFLTEEPPVLVDWLPWNHVFGGSHNVGIALTNGGTLYVDDGKPTPQGMAETLRNLREIPPSVYFNVPKGLEEIARAMEGDTVLRDTLFARCKAIMFAGAALSQPVWDALHRHAEAAVGERVRVITGLGMTEAAPTCTFAVGTDVASGHIGLPVPGVEMKLVPETAGAASGGKIEVRFRGPHITPGYWREPALTARAFDDEGFYISGDAVRWRDEANPQLGLVFDGRIVEDFKLASGTFVSVGPLRAKIIAAGDPLVQDAVITGLNRNDVGALVVPRVDDLRRLVAASAKGPSSEELAGWTLPQLMQHHAVRTSFQALVERLAREATGSASRITRLVVLDTPLSIDAGEVTDKGSINQRRVLAERAALVEALHDDNAVMPLRFMCSGNSRGAPQPAATR